MTSKCNGKVWIDLDNSPHIPFFKPIIEELTGRGCKVTLTARDSYQVCDLADHFGLNYKKIGKHWGKYKVLKSFGLIVRSLQMIPTILREKPDIAISHGARSQLFLAGILGITSITVSDYEHSSTRFVIRPQLVMVPDVMPDSAVKFKGTKVHKYPGIKEDVYVPFFVPDPAIRKDLEIKEQDIVATVRPPATEAHYHNPQSEKLFEAAVDFLGGSPDTRLVITPRTKNQKALIQNRWSQWCHSGKIVIPQIVDGLNLIWFSDLVVSGGGTMNREAAALGVPVYSIFRGQIGAVDRYLADTGRLTLLESVEDVRSKISVTRRHRRDISEKRQCAALNSIVGKVLEVLENH
jgi:predicted glycosyltransferase